MGAGLQTLPCSRLSRYNTMHEVDEVLKVMPGIVATLRKLSPYWDGNGPVANPEQAFQPTYA